MNSNSSIEYTSPLRASKLAARDDEERLQLPRKITAERAAVGDLSLTPPSGLGGQRAPLAARTNDSDQNQYCLSNQLCLCRQQPSHKHAARMPASPALMCLPPALRALASPTAAFSLDLSVNNLFMRAHECGACVREAYVANSQMCCVVWE